jgi:hypothetical protein
MNDPNLPQLVRAAEALRPLLSDLVFVGGCMTGLLITDPGAPSPRGTMDVDAIAEITSYEQYSRFGERLRALGFAEDLSEGAPVCGGSRIGQSSMSCLWTRTSCDFRIDGTELQWKDRLPG